MYQITSTIQAHRHGVSVSLQAVEAQDAMAACNWEEAADLLSMIADDAEKLQAYVNAKLAALEAEK